MGHLEDVVRELAEVQDELLALPDEAFAERYALLKRQDALRVEAAEFHRDADAARPTSDLHAERDALRTQLDRMVLSRTGFASSKGGSNSGPAVAAWVKLGVAARDS